ncbi:hypothetical protein [Agrococcus sp. HG114]|uniref:hypothetical protein n=1 Tax=Agrococcus sp. HG114 TaxID=2969757 RepID=UPI00215B44C3|nr:hypothetical protein [Agrococcus sp. HG114]MCR8670651.1 hypothetical protein [Agrococcus sp. HG114]
MLQVRCALVLTAALLAGCASAGAAPDPEPSSDWAPAAVQAGGLRVLAESDRDGFRLHTASGDKGFLPGVNVGATVPLHQPGEIDVLTADDYRRWFPQMADLGIRVVRIYTLHPPTFYDELAAYNAAHPSEPLYLVQGVYLPDERYVEEGGTLCEPALDEAFSAELSAVSAAVHGDLERAAAPGAASGRWTTDVSPWLAAWIVGVEWDPAGTARTDAACGAGSGEPGRYFAPTDDASGTERWIARHMDDLAALEAARGDSVPIALANWPTTDPLVHDTEPLETEDLVGVDANHVLPTAAWPGGTFASFHAYPYYPDFQRYEPGYDEQEWRGESDRYAGYLAALQEHFAERMPLLVTEFGVPTSLGSAHAGTLGRDQGGHDESTAMAMNADMARMMAGLGLGGAFVFSWTDEWFKHTWNTMEHQVPERRQLWHDPLTNEQWFGIVATDSDLVPDAVAEERPSSGPFEHISVRADASWVHIDLALRERLPRELSVGVDVLPGPLRDDYRVLVDTEAATARAEVRQELDPMRLDTAVRPYHPDAADEWHLYRLLTNRAHHLGDRVLPAEHHEPGLLVEGDWDPASAEYDSRATWSADAERRSVRLRLPWPMLGMADPSSRTALGEGEPAQLVHVDGVTLRFAADGSAHELDFRWPEWNRVGHTERLKDGSGAIAAAFAELAP